MNSLFRIVKYLPIVCGLIMTCHCALLISGEDCEILKEFFSFGWVTAILMTILSYKLKMCIYHRLFVWYDFLLDMCIKCQRYDLFADMGIDVYYARIAVLAVGISFELLLIYKMTYGRRCRQTSTPTAE